ncbi:MAG: hypothetical protein K0R54_2121 [Clostridiaceae bacterium]|jgi:hypothetical protein|nr:hypothetical protein [Clostridiaceae bacterium]
MSTTTTKLGLIKPASDEFYDIDVFNSNSDILDTFAIETITTDKLVNNLAATEDGFALNAKQGSVIQGEINTINTNLALKANDTDNTRTTTSKTVTGAINELNSNKAPLASPNFTGTTTAGGFNLLRALNGGYKVQDGSSSVTVVTAGTGIDVTVTFPTAFSSSPLVFATIVAITGGDSGYISARVSSVSATQVVFRCNSYVPQTLTFNWLALGN